jgi:hypothetical protein
MSEQKRQTGPLFFNLLVAGLTGLSFAISESVLLLLGRTLHGVAIFLLVLGLVKAPIVGLFSGLMVQGGRKEKAIGLRISGGVLGSYFGLTAGVLIGSALGGAIGGAIGTIGMFILCRYFLGPRTSLAIGRQLERFFVII